MGERLSREDALESRATIEYVGFNSVTAERLWNTWDAMLADDQELEGFLCFITGVIKDSLWSSLDVEYGRDNYIAALTRWGLKDEHIQGITHIDFDDIMHTKTAAAWALEVVQDRYEYLEQAHSASTSRQRQRSTGEAPRRVPSFSVASGQGRMFPGIRNEPGSTAFWKATLRQKLHSVKTQGIDADHFKLDTIRSAGPTDFDRTSFGYYFTPSLAVAKRYAQYAFHTHPRDEVVLMRINVPNHLIEGANSPYILNFPTAQFKKVVWLSRRGCRYTRDLQDIKAATLVIGDICRCTAHVFSAMRSPDEITEHNLLKVTGSHGIEVVGRQYYFSDDFQEILEENLTQQHLTIHHPERPEVEVDIN